VPVIDAVIATNPDVAVAVIEFVATAAQAPGDAR
jgi:hypothetical protein